MLPRLRSEEWLVERARSEEREEDRESREASSFFLKKRERQDQRRDSPFAMSQVTTRRQGPSNY